MDYGNIFSVCLCTQRAMTITDEKPEHACAITLCAIITYQKTLPIKGFYLVQKIQGPSFDSELP